MFLNDNGLHDNLSQARMLAKVIRVVRYMQQIADRNFPEVIVRIVVVSMYGENGQLYIDIWILEVNLKLFMVEPLCFEVFFTLALDIMLQNI